MAKSPLLYCASDKEIYDALASSPQHFSEDTLHEMAQKRGIFYSPEAERMELCSAISLLGFGFNGVAQIQAEFEKSARSEKKTFKTLDTPLSLDEFKAIATAYQEEAASEGETVSWKNLGPDHYTLNVKYEEVDFSRTRLRQRQRRQALIDMKVRDGKTVITYPSNEKVKQAVEGLIERAKGTKQANITVDEVDLSWITSYELRTKFFQDLIKSIPGFTLEDVTRVQVDFGAPLTSEADLLSDSDAVEAKDAAETEVANAVRNIALNGNSLHLSAEYNRLKRKGFFLTSIQWSARRVASPNEIVDFDAGFDEPAAGVGYRYGVRTWTLRLESGQYAKNAITVPTDDKIALSSLLQQASMSVYLAIKGAFNKGKAQSNGGPL